MQGENTLLTAAKVVNSSKSLFKPFQSQLKTELKMIKSQKEGLKSLTEAQRNQIHGNIVYIKARLLEIDIKVSKTARSLRAKLNAEKIKTEEEQNIKKQENIRKKIKKEEKKTAPVEKQHQTLQEMIDQYEKAFLQLEDETSLPEVSKHSLETFRPKRGDLLDVYDDFFVGALNLASGSGESEGFEEQVRRVVNTIKEEMKNDPAIGGGNPDEPLSLYPEEFKKQNQEASSAFDKYYTRLIIAYASLKNPDTPENPDTPVDSDLINKISKDIIKERNNLLNSAERWKEGINRTLVSNGVSFTNNMTCLNQGYASSAFRGRSLEDKPVSANLWRTRFTKETSGERTPILLEHTSSALQVEFFQPNPEERMKSSIFQVGEVLSDKVVRKLEQMGEAEKNQQANSKENPYILETTEVSLLSPDCIRHWLMKANAGKFKGVAGKASKKHFDDSQYERRMLLENKDAWLAFDMGSGGQPGNLKWKDGDCYSYTDGEGNIRTMTAHLEKEEKVPTFEITTTNNQTGAKTTYFAKFDIAYLNTGANTFQSLMVTAVNDQKLKADLNALVTKINKKVPLVNVLKPNLSPSATLEEAVQMIQNPFTRAVLIKVLSTKGIAVKSDDLKNLIFPDFRKVEKTIPKGLSETEKFIHFNIALIKSLVSNDAGKNVLQALLKKKGINIEENALKELIDNIQNTDFNQVLNSPQKARPTMHRLLQIGLPLLQTLLGTEGGKEIIKKPLAKKGVSKEDLEGLQAPSFEEPTGLDEYEGEILNREKALETTKTGTGEDKKRIKEETSVIESQKKTLATLRTLEKDLREHEKLTNESIGSINWNGSQKEINEQVFNAANSVSNLKPKYQNLLDSIKKFVDKEESSAHLENLKSSVEKELNSITDLHESINEVEILTPQDTEVSQKQQIENLKSLFNKVASIKESRTIKEGISIEDQMNHEAFEKFKARFNRKIESVDESLKITLKKITDKNEMKIIENIKNSIEALKTSRENLIQCEKNYKDNPTEENDQARMDAFSAESNGWKALRKGLKEEFDKLLGPDSKQTPSPELKKYLNKLEYKVQLTELFEECSDLLNYKEHRTSEMMQKSMYILPSRIVSLSMFLGEDPNTGCRSGKDRTSLQRIAIGMNFHLKEIHGRFLNYREFKDPEVLKEIKLIDETWHYESGMIDMIALLNIGAVGLNLRGVNSGLGSGADTKLDFINSAGVSMAFKRDPKVNVSSNLEKILKDPGRKEGATQRALKLLVGQINHAANNRQDLPEDLNILIQIYVNKNIDIIKNNKQDISIIIDFIIEEIFNLDNLKNENSNASDTTPKKRIKR